MPVMKLLFLNNLNFETVLTMIALLEHVTFSHLMKKIMNLFTSFARTMEKISWQTAAFLYTLKLERNLYLYKLINCIFLYTFFIRISTHMKIFIAFFLAQQGETKAIIPKRIAYHYNFGKCIKNYLPFFL